jgi:uncharacterized protein YjbJ (UPF0337 family)
MDDQMKGKWLQLRGELKKAWGRLTDDDFAQADGQWDVLIGRIQERYGYTKQKAQEEVNRFREEHDLMREPEQTPAEHSEPRKRKAA